MIWGASGRSHWHGPRAPDVKVACSRRLTNGRRSTSACATAAYSSRSQGDGRGEPRGVDGVPGAMVNAVYISGTCRAPSTEGQSGLRHRHIGGESAVQQNDGIAAAAFVIPGVHAVSFHALTHLIPSLA